jgi:hypothetical protein
MARVMNLPEARPHDNIAVLATSPLPSGWFSIPLGWRFCPGFRLISLSGACLLGLAAAGMFVTCLKDFSSSRGIE